MQYMHYIYQHVQYLNAVLYPAAPPLPPPPSQAESAKLLLDLQQRLDTISAALTAERSHSTHLTRLNSLLQQQVQGAQDGEAAAAEAAAAAAEAAAAAAEAAAAARMGWGLWLQQWHQHLGIDNPQLDQWIQQAQQAQQQQQQVALP